ncbi:hypothetical protein [Pedosphaera parvula]|uniref:Uncharacterized protein n=1 Tax=Pedosphaera parvula (strain Ellin514) TaxID=320771 RepID=B9XC21_PEDPL|nr:hypothetical protein [Pedosphaera parvula]EEF62489.1 hypothetical protein Cflav_PD5124 [Pedosphaera parvula Ellin514]
MQTSIIHSTTEANQDLEIKPFFNVVIAYEDFAAGKHAQETYDFLVSQLGRDYIFSNQMWKFDLLGNSKMKEMAVKDAEAADLIIISSHGTSELPGEVKSWIDQWTSEKGHAMALVNLVDCPEEGGADSTQLKVYLQSVARKAKMDFFSQPNEWPDKEVEPSNRHNSEMAQRTSSLMANFIHHSHNHHCTSTPRWGINE